MRLAKMMRLYIAAEGMEQIGVAVACGVSATTMSRFLAGDRLPDAAAFARIQAWCADVPQASGHWAFDPDQKIGGPNAPYRQQPAATANLCAACGVDWSGAMGYVCGRTDCPVQPKVTCAA